MQNQAIIAIDRNPLFLGGRIRKSRLCVNEEFKA